jgi:ferric-chelate reductase
MLLKTAGSIFMVLSGPVLVIAFLSIAYVIISGEEELHEYVFFFFKWRE